jgi:hypothetical protein
VFTVIVIQTSSSLRVRAIFAAASLFFLPVAANGQVVTKAFQNGLNGYTGTFDRLISSTVSQERDGSTVAAYFMDGFDGGTSADAQNLIRFDNIIGPGANQIPSNATILDAKLTVTTSLAGDAQTAGPYGVSGILSHGFTSTTTHADYPATSDHGHRGPWWQDASATRPVGGFGFQLPGAPDSANVTSIVQSWASGAPNFGFAMQAGLADVAAQNANTADGWSIHTTGFPTSDTRPKLNVTYTTAPVTVNTFQRGLNGYNGDSMAIVRSGFNALNPDPLTEPPGPNPPEVTEDASTLSQTFLDGVFFTNTAGDTSSRDDLALLKFGGVFGSSPGQAPSNVPVAKAWAVITTGDTSVDARSPGPYSAHTMLREWTTSSLHSSFGAVNGLQVGDGDISPALDLQDGMIRGSEVWFDVTDYLEGVRTGEADNGIAILTTGTADGWQIHTIGSATEPARPRLVVYSADLGINQPLEGDFNTDGKVDAIDYIVWRNSNGPQAAYNQWLANFGKTSPGSSALGSGVVAGTSGAAVPEPATVVLLLVTTCGWMTRWARQ